MKVLLLYFRKGIDRVKGFLQGDHTSHWRESLAFCPSTIPTLTTAELLLILAGPGRCQRVACPGRSKFTPHKDWVGGEGEKWEEWGRLLAVQHPERAPAWTSTAQNPRMICRPLEADPGLQFIRPDKSKHFSLAGGRPWARGSRLGWRPTSQSRRCPLSFPAPPQSPGPNEGLSTAPPHQSCGLIDQRDTGTRFERGGAEKGRGSAFCILWMGGAGSLPAFLKICPGFLWLQSDLKGQDLGWGGGASLCAGLFTALSCPPPSGSVATTSPGTSKDWKADRLVLSPPRNLRAANPHTHRGAESMGTAPWPCPLGSGQP